MIASRQTYIAAITAWKGGKQIWSSVLRISAMSKGEAAAKAEEVSRRLWPAADGFTGHNAIAEPEASQAVIDEPDQALFGHINATSTTVRRAPNKERIAES